MKNILFMNIVFIVWAWKHFSSLYWPEIFKHTIASFPWHTSRGQSTFLLYDFYSQVRRRQWHPTPVLLPGKSHGWRSLEGCSPWGRWGSDTTERLTFTFHFHALEKEMATHSSVLAWRIPGTGEPSGLPSMGLHRVRHNWSDLAAAAAAVPTLLWVRQDQVS